MSLAGNSGAASGLPTAGAGGTYGCMIRIKDKRTGEVLLEIEGDSLRGADLRSADLLAADLRNADLRGADLTLADLRGADLEGANLEGANLHLASYTYKTRWPEGFDPRKTGAKLVYDPSSSASSSRPWWQFWK